MPTYDATQNTVSAGNFPLPSPFASVNLVDSDGTGLSRLTLTSSDASDQIFDPPAAATMPLRWYFDGIEYFKSSTTDSTGANVVVFHDGNNLGFEIRGLSTNSLTIERAAVDRNASFPGEMNAEHVESFLEQIGVYNSSNASSRTFTGSVVQDDGASTNISVTVPTSNAPPELGGYPSDDTAVEDQATTIDLSAYNVSDADGDTITLTLGVSRGSIASIDGNTISDGVTIAGSGSASMTLQGSAANLNSYLNNTSKITFTTAPNDVTSATLTVTPFDGAVNGSSDTVVIAITSINDAPNLMATGSNPTFTEGGAAGSLFSGTSISTVEAGQTIEGLTLTVAGLVDGASEILTLDGTAIGLSDGASGTTATNSLSYSVSVVGTTATLSLTGGTLSVGAAEMLIDGASYQNNSQDPGTSNRVVTLTEVQDSGGTANGGSDTATLSVASTVSVTGVNDAPTLTATGSNPTFTEGGAAGSLFSGTSISTVEAGQTIEGLTLTVAGLADGARETLTLDGTAIGLSDGASGTTATNSLSYSVSVVGTTATLSLAGGPLSVGAAETLIDGASYQNNSQNPGTSNRVVTLTEVQDSGGTANGGSDTATLSVASTVSVIGVNDPVTGNLLITGKPLEGETLSVDASNLRDRDGLGSFSYQWLNDDTPIEGATAVNYVLTESDVGGSISVVVRYRDGSGFIETVVSEPTTYVVPLGETINGTAGPDILLGTEGADSIFAMEGNDTVTGAKGDDLINGGSGVDTAKYSGPQSSYTLTLSATGTTITDRRVNGDGTDVLEVIELLDFETTDVFDLTIFGGAAGLSQSQFESIIELYTAIFDRAPDAVGLNFWGTAFANGLSLEDMAALFMDQSETRDRYPEGLGNDVFATAVYNNVLGRDPDGPGLTFWVKALDTGSVSRDHFILQLLGGVQDGTPDADYLSAKTDIGAYFAVIKGMSDTASASDVMALFDGTEAGLLEAVAAINEAYIDALDAEGGEFLMPLVGVLDDPFSMI